MGAYDRRYILMNKNTELAELYVSDTFVGISRPLNYIPEYLGDVNEWVNNRFNLFGRDNILNMAKLAGINKEYEFLTISKAISLTDTFWVNDLQNPTTWSKVNPYTNRLSRIMAEIAIDGINIYNNKDLRSPSPQYKIDGSADKCIKRGTNGVNYLYKTNGTPRNNVIANRPYSEYFASELSKILELSSFTKYMIREKITDNGEIKPYSICSLFTNEDIGLVQMCNTNYNRLDTRELYEVIPRESKLILKEMALLDSIILNSDRHTGNYGFIYNNNSLKLINLAPIYDNDYSLGSTVSIKYSSFEDAFDAAYAKQPRLGLGSYNEQAQWAMTRSMYNKLKGLGKIRINKQQTHMNGIDDKRVEFINYIINRRIQEILNLFE